MLKVKDKDVKLNAVQKKMLASLTIPMERSCPSGLRYELAKYDADDVTDAYFIIYELWKNGKIIDERDAQ